MIIDFIKSWLYYPKLEKWFSKHMKTKCPYTRLEYSLMHCKYRKLKNK